MREIEKKHSNEVPARQPSPPKVTSPVKQQSPVKPV